MDMELGMGARTEVGTVAVDSTECQQSTEEAGQSKSSESQAAEADSDSGEEETALVPRHRPHWRPRWLMHDEGYRSVVKEISYVNSPAAAAGESTYGSLEFEELEVGIIDVVLETGYDALHGL